MIISASRELKCIYHSFNLLPCLEFSREAKDWKRRRNLKQDLTEPYSVAWLQYVMNNRVVNHDIQCRAVKTSEETPGEIQA